MKYTQLERPIVGRTFQGMARVTNPNALREVLSIHSSDDVGNKTSSGGGRHPTMVIKRPKVDPSLSCISPTGSEAKSNRTAKGSEAIKSVFRMNGEDQCVEGIERGNVASVTET